MPCSKFRCGRFDSPVRWVLVYRFIKQEAEEKSSEISVAAEEEFNITKLQLLESEKAKVRRDYERREKAIVVKKKVEHSKLLNESRLKVLQAREDAVQAVIKDAQKSLGTLSMNASEYESLMLALIVQGMYKLKENAVKVRCREIDVSLVQSLLPRASKLFSEKYGSNAPDVTLDEKNPLPPPPRDVPSSDGFHEYSFCSGGVVVASADGSIECSNTLDDRLRIAYTTNLPEIRSKLFGSLE